MNTRAVQRQVVDGLAFDFTDAVDNGSKCAALMVRNNEGLTKTYNRFHDPQERSPDIQTLRDLHARMDATVLAA